MSATLASIHEVFDHQKSDLLIHLLESSPEKEHVMVYTRTRDGVHALTAELNRTDVRVESLHGQKKLELRNRAISALKQGKVRVLVATDAVARELDLSGVHHVINVDVPELDSDYLARLEAVGVAEGQMLTMISPKDVQERLRLEQLTGVELPSVQAEGFIYDSHPSQVKSSRKKGGKSKGLRSKPLQNKKPKFKHKRGR